ncbi:hypothetical protein BBBOND_0304290 [Babesia bigemina]|uniref:Uncharacterized protein n=1 Tax=Babesia bigemina TaxID=5866 RepID=A0A061DDS4_BABBI|nr:hypothetical protein BBBOND_0304290 [Babesia bigemina]CDR96525.1 hypothetical protein BBBOND_0304290 [Babesia bigemina]|eukprot:XP_012768711.1 hypothetical protein BBBOND_0304290 [Babesia bigemina]
MERRLKFSLTQNHAHTHLNDKIDALEVSKYFLLQCSSPTMHSECPQSQLMCGCTASRERAPMWYRYPDQNGSLFSEIRRL